MAAFRDVGRGLGDVDSLLDSLGSIIFDSCPKQGSELVVTDIHTGRTGVRFLSNMLEKGSRSESPVTRKADADPPTLQLRPRKQ